MYIKDVLPGFVADMPETALARIPAMLGYFHFSERQLEKEDVFACGPFFLSYTNYR